MVTRARSRNIIAIRRASPNGDEGEQQGHERDAEINPRPVAMGVPGRNEQVDQHPKAEAQAQGRPDEITERDVEPSAPDMLRSGDTRYHDEQCNDDYRAEKYPRNFQTSWYA
jgi:hypothetical protein